MPMRLFVLFIEFCLNNSQRRQMCICIAWSNMALTHSMQQERKKNVLKTFTFNVTLNVRCCCWCCCLAEIAMRIRASNLCYVSGFFLLSCVGFFFYCCFIFLECGVLFVCFVLYQNGFIRWNSIKWKDFIIFISLAV